MIRILHSAAAHMKMHSLRDVSSATQYKIWNIDKNILEKCRTNEYYHDIKRHILQAVEINYKKETYTANEIEYKSSKVSVSIKLMITDRCRLLKAYLSRTFSSCRNLRNDFFVRISNLISRRDSFKLVYQQIQEFCTSRQLTWECAFSARYRCITPARGYTKAKIFLNVAQTSNVVIMLSVAHITQFT